MDGEPIENQKNQSPELLLSEREFWARPASARLIEAIGCRAGASIGEAVDAALEKLEERERPEDVSFDRLREIHQRVEVFLEPEDAAYLRSIGLLRRAPKAGEFRAWTPQQRASEERASAELLQKFEQMNESDHPQRERAARVIQSLAVRGRITSEERSVLAGRGLLDEDFPASGPIQ
jgi:hypothetical protein